MSNISLVGFMGAGKTSVARTLSQKLKRKLISIDDLIVTREGRPITEIFAHKGEAYFRRLEKDFVAEASAGDNQIIDCGGGVMMKEENVANLKRHGVIVHLKTSAEEVFRRVRDEKHRPLLNVPDPKAEIEKLLAARAPFYAKADITVVTDGKTVDQVAEEIIKVVSGNT